MAIWGFQLPGWLLSIVPLLALMPNTRAQFLSFELACKFLHNNKLIILTKPKHYELLSV